LTKKEKLRTRVILAQSIGIAPDCVTYFKKFEGLFEISYKGYNLITGFFDVPTIEYAREHIKDLYLAGVELEFDEGVKSSI
jgi:hypothetical protein